MKNFFASKINWAGIILVITAIMPLIESQNFSGMGVKDWFLFAMGVAVVVFRTYFTSTKIGKK